MTEETVKAVSEMLARHGYKDVTEEHSWNMLQMEKSSVLGTLTVWRSDDDHKLTFQMAQGYEERIHIVDTSYLARLEQTIIATDQYCDAILLINPEMKIHEGGDF